VLGIEHPKTLTSVSDLGQVLQRQCKYSESEAMAQRALAGREAMLGTEHLDTLMSVCCLAYLFHNQKEYSKASIYYERARHGFQKVLGPKNSTTRSCAKNYSIMLKERDES